MNSEFKRMMELAGLSEIKINKPKKSRIRVGEFYVEFTPEYYKNIEEYGDMFYYEKGLTNKPEIRNGKKVRGITAYYEYEDDAELVEDFDTIGYIYPVSEKDIESYSEDELDDAFIKAINPSLTEIKINKPTSLLDNLLWTPELYNFFKNDQDIFKNSGIDSIIKTNLHKIIDNIWEAYTNGWQENDIEEYNEGDITDYPKTRDDLLNPDKQTGSTSDVEYYIIGEFLFPYILKHLKENGWEHIEDDFFSKDGREAEIFYYIKPLESQDTSPRENLWERFLNYIEDNY
jgi:hypothetical protein